MLKIKKSPPVVSGKDYYDIFFANSPVPMIIFNKADLAIVDVNQAACQLYDYDVNHFLHLNINDLKDSEFKLNTNLSSYNPFLKPGIWRHVTKDKKEIFVLIRGSEIKESDRCLLALEDFTERIQIEEERKKLIRDLERQNLDLQQFTYIISHNLRAPVANILAYASQFNKQNFADELNAVVVDTIDQLTHRLDNVLIDLNSLLDIRKNMHSVEDSTDVEQLIAQAIEMLDNHIKSSKARVNIQVDVPKQLFTVKAYLFSVIFNLISNAVKHRHPDRPPVVDIKIWLDAEDLCIIVSDNGQGIDLEKYGQKLFGLYNRFNLSTQGKGMGLHLVKTQLESLGGSIDVESSPGEGSSFFVKLRVKTKE